MKLLFTSLLTLVTPLAFSQCEVDESIDQFSNQSIGGIAAGINEHIDVTKTMYVPYGFVEHADFQFGDAVIHEVGIREVEGLPEGINFEAYLDSGTEMDTSIIDTVINGWDWEIPHYYPVAENPGYSRICFRFYGTPTELMPDNAVHIGLSFMHEGGLFPLNSNGFYFNIPFLVIEDMYTPFICVVSSDLETGNNQVIWNKLATNVTDSFRIYSDIASTPTAPIHIGTVPYDSLSVFTDTVNIDVDDEITYHLSMVNTSGVESQQSTGHTGIHLDIDTFNGQYGFWWTEYWPLISLEEEYLLYSGPSPDNMTLAQSVPFTFNYTALPITPELTYYAVGTTIAADCFPSRNGEEQSFSNVVSNSLFVGYSERHSIDLRIYPNPASETLVTNISELTTTVDVSDLESGTYSVQFVSTEGVRSELIHILNGR